MLLKSLNRLVATAILGAGLIMTSGPVMAAGDTMFDPTPSVQLAPTLAAPNLFGGAYAGVAVGLQVNHFGTFFSDSTHYRMPGGVFAGYNYVLSPYLIAGVEAQIDATYDPWSTPTQYGYNAFAVGRVGFLTSPDFMIYQLAQLGLIDGTPAFGLGVGIEQQVTDDFSLRFEAAAHGQIPSATTGTYYGGFTSMKIALGALWYLDGDASRDGWHIGTNTDPVTDFIGPYAGFYVGGAFNPDYSFFVPTPLNGYHLSNFNQGVMAGYNFDVAGPVRAGLEVQGGFHYNTSGNVNVEGLALARLGVVPFDGVMVYGTAGAGSLDGTGAYALGGGVEYALWGDATLRADVQVLSMIPPGASAGEFAASKWNLGTIWHFN